MDRGARQATVHAVAGVRHNLATKPPPVSHCMETPAYLDSFFFFFAVLCGEACRIFVP